MKNNEIEITRFNAISKALNLGYIAKFATDLENDIGDLISIGCMQKGLSNPDFWCELFVIGEKSDEGFPLTMFVANHGSFFEPPSTDYVEKGMYEHLSKAFDKVIEILVADVVENVSLNIWECEYEKQQEEYLANAEGHYLERHND